MKYAIPTHPTCPSYTLSDETIIGRGNKRDCHAHPNDPNLCIKVARYIERWNECQEQNIVEWYYTTHLKQQQIPLDHVPNCYGWVNTNYGAGLVIERIREPNGSSALTLRNALAVGRINEDQINHMLMDLKRWAIKYAVVIADLNTDNLMIRGDNNKNYFVLIDGFGSRKADWKFTLYQRLPLFSKMKTRRQWKRQEKSLFATIKEIRNHA